jgi:nucleoside-diphosphate-sugar epimerase
VKSLLTGGNAFVSRVIGPALLAAGHDVTVCLRPGQTVPNWIRQAGDNVTTRRIDLAGENSLEALVAGHGVIIHAAGRLEDPRTPTQVFERDNTRATEALIAGAAATGCPRMINFSSMSVYGSINRDLVDERTPCRHPTPYGASKLASERALRDGVSKLSSISLRLPGIVGPHAHGNWLARCRLALRSGDPVSITNPDFRFNNTLHVEDLAGFIIALCGRTWSGAWAFPIGARMPMTIRDLIEAMKTTIGSMSTIDVSTDTRPPFAISSDLAIREFGYQPVSVREVINRFIADA